MEIVLDGADFATWVGVGLELWGFVVVALDRFAGVVSARGLLLDRVGAAVERRVGLR